MKYMGSKKRLQKYIAPIINDLIEKNDITTYVEPFVGGANMIEAINCNKRFGYDNNKYLIELLKYVSAYGLEELPLIISREHYVEVRSSYNNNDMLYKDYYIGYIGFMGSYNGRFFDGGYSGHAVIEKGKNGTRDFIGQTISNLKNQIDKLKDVTFEYSDFADVTVENCLIYCDPPYFNTKKYSTSKNFDYEKFYDWVRKMSKNNIVIVSEYQMPDDFTEIWSKEIKTNMMNTLGGERKTNVEKLFSIENEDVNNNYVVYHLHSDYSNTNMADSTTKVQDYVDRAKELGMKALGFSEHGVLYNWVKKKKIIEAAGMKYIHGVEAYVTETLEEKVRDNYHVGLYARNIDGVKELNELMYKASNREDNHFHYTSRISLEELYQTSNNIIITTACMGSPLMQWFKDNNQERLNEFLLFAIANKKRVFLEVQYHLHEDQKRYNKALAYLSNKHDLVLIAGTDTHSLNAYHAECRTILQKSKGIDYGDEDLFDLTFKTYDELVEAFQKQDVLDDKTILKAINNTNIFIDIIEDIELDHSFKYPQIGENPTLELKTKLQTNFKQMVKDGIIPKDRKKEYTDRLNQEFKVFKKLETETFMLIMEDLSNYCEVNGIARGSGRGSSAGSLASYVLKITDVDAIKYGTIFSRFMNADRVSLPDIDTDIDPKRVPEIEAYLTEKYGQEYTSKISIFNTIAYKGTIDAICRALDISIDKAKSIKKQYESNPDKAIKNNPEVFRYFEGLKDTITSVGMHPAGLIVAPNNIIQDFGCFINKDGITISNCDMSVVEELNYVKLDLLGVNNVAIVSDAYKYLGKDYPKMHEIDFTDQNVYKEMIAAPYGMFQYESNFAFDNLKAMKPKKLYDLALLNGVLRPSGDSFRDNLVARRFNKNPSTEIDELFKDSMGFIVFQEQMMEFLIKMCGLSASDSDTCRRYISKKKEKEMEVFLPKIIDGYCDNSTKEREVAEEEVKQFIQILSDSASYQFNYSHALAYSQLGFITGYLRHYHPLEFTTALLNNAKDQDVVVKGEALAKFKKIPIYPIKYRKSQGSYSIDKENNSIYKGIASINHLTDTMAAELYEIGKTDTFDNFLDFVQYLCEYSSVKTNQLDILIKLNFFQEYGTVDKLLNIVYIFNNGYKEYHPKMAKYSKGVRDETKAFKMELYKEYFASNKVINHVEYGIKDQMAFELGVLGAIRYTSDDYEKNEYIVTEVNTKYKPRLDLYRIRDGRTFTVKIDKKTFKNKPLTQYDLISVTSGEHKNKWKFIDGKTVETSEREYHLLNYKILE